MSMKLFLSPLGLTALGAIVFAGFAGLVEYRQGRPLHPPAQAQASEGQTEAHPLEVLTVGARVSTTTAQHALERGARSEAVHALDAAMRAAAVGKHAAHGKPKDAFAQALKTIKQARHVLQNGKPTAAQRHLKDAVATLDAIATAVPTDQTPLPDQATWSDYQDAVLLNALGLRIGELDHLQTSESGPAEAVLVLGGGQDVLGLFDVGGTERIVPADRLLFGKRQTIGAIHVVLPTLASSVQQIENTVPLASRSPAS
jgi:hypothetical protein